MTCPSCGVEAPAGARFCGACGASIERRTDERRTVSVLFADLVGYTTLAETRDPEAVKNLVDSCFERLVADVIAFGGVVDKIIGDAIVALFGAPVAHEDDPERAVRAALRMQETLGRQAERIGLDLRIRVGINTGEVLVGTLRAGGEYTAMGDVVNTASRLQSLAAPGQVLVGPATHAATAAAFKYESLGLLRAKGRDEPVPAWVALEPLGLPGARPRVLRAPLVGRDEELGLLRNALATTRARRRAGVVLLLGEAGAGKTRLVEELVVIARGEGAFVLEGRCVPYGEVNVWAPVVEALRRAAGVTADDVPDVAEAKSRSAVAAILDLPPDAPEVERMMHGLSPLMGKPVGARAGSMARARPDGTGFAESDSIGEEALDPVTVCLRHMCAERPLLFVIGELHWADDKLLAFVARLVERVVDQPILLLCTARPEILDRWTVPDGRFNRTVLHVDPLDRAASAELLAHLAGADLTAEQREVLVERSGGNPLWLEELAALSCAPADGDAGHLPDTLRGMVAARLDQLDPAARSVLADAAVCGRTGSVAYVAAMADTDSIDVALDALGSAGLVSLIHGRESWELRSDLIREVAYGTLTKADRARRHARLATWLAIRASEHPRDDELDDLAHHWAAAADLVLEMGSEDLEGVPEDTLERAVHWVGMAAQRACQQELWLPAAALLDMALSFTQPGDPTQPVLLLDRARARTGLRDADGVAADLAALRPLLPTAGDPVRVGALVVAGDLARIQANFPEAERLLADARDLAREVGDVEGELAALRSLGSTRLFAGDDDGARAVAEETLQVARACGDRKGEAWALQQLAWAAFSQGDMPVAKDRLYESAKAFEEISDWGGHGWAEGLLAWVTFACGELDEAETIARRVLVDAARSGDTWAISMMRTLIANARLWSGHPAEAIVEAEVAASGMATVDDSWGLTQVRMVLGRARLAAGEVALGRAVLEQATSAARRLDDPGPLRNALSVQMIALALQVGDGQAALAAPPDVIDVQLINRDEVLSAMAVANLQVGDLAEAGRTLAPMLGWETPAEAPRLAPAVAPWVALTLVALGRPADAAAVLDCVPAAVPATYLDRAWMAVARLAVTGASVAAEEAQAIVDSTEDVLAQVNVQIAITGLTSGFITPEPGWERMWTLVRAGHETATTAPTYR